MSGHGSTNEINQAPLVAPQVMCLDLNAFTQVDRELIRDRLFMAMHKAMSACDNRTGYFALTDALGALQYQATIIYVDAIQPRERRPILLALIDVSAELAGLYFSEGRAAHAWAKIADLRNYAWEQLIALEPHIVREDIDHGT